MVCAFFLLDKAWVEALPLYSFVELTLHVIGCVAEYSALYLCLFFIIVVIISQSLSVKHAFLSSDYASAPHPWSELSLTQHQV